MTVRTVIEQAEVVPLVGVFDLAAHYSAVGFVVVIKIFVVVIGDDCVKNISVFKVLV